MQALGFIETKEMLAAIEAADAGAAAAEQIHCGCLVSRHVIPRPHEELELIKELGISGRRISKANRSLLLKELKYFYGI